MMAEVQIYSGGVTPPRQSVSPTARPPELTTTQAKSTTGEDRAAMTKRPCVMFRADLYSGRTILTLRLPRRLNFTPTGDVQRTEANSEEELIRKVLDPRTRHVVQAIRSLSEPLYVLRLIVFPDGLMQVFCKPVVQMPNGRLKIESVVRRIAQICYKSAGVDCTEDDIQLIKEDDLPRR